MYLTLSDFDHLRAEPTVRFREETVDGVEVVIISYMISNDDLWNIPLGLECRGITFRKDTGELISLPFEKFFNVNEKAWTQVSEIKDYEILSVLDKRDGSMITPALINGEIFLKTKKTFFSDVAICAQNDLPDNVRLFCGSMMREGLCPIFEYTSPNSKIVINYGSYPRFVLLAVRDMSTGEYLSFGSVQYYADRYGVDCIDEDPYFFEPSIEGLLGLTTTTSETEGWVVYTTNGRFKIKTQWYMDRHRLIDVRERDIAEFVLDDKLDDMISSLIEGEADMESVHRIEKEVSSEFCQLLLTVSSFGNQAAAIPLGKERADWVNENCGELARFVHRAARGLENSDEQFKDFYRQKYLSKFSLKSIGNPSFRGEEA